MSTAFAADVPALPSTMVVKKKTPKLQKPAVKLRPAVAGKPAEKKPPANAKKATAEPIGSELNLVWTLEPLVANSDGPRREDSASVEANLVVTDPGLVAATTMIIELSGHIIKTARTTARIDVRIGKAHRTVNWNSDDIQSGKFNISLSEPLIAGKLPEYFPVSALAFVTRDGKEGAAMVSLAKVVVRVEKVKFAGKKENPATDVVTGSISKK